MKLHPLALMISAALSSGAFAQDATPLPAVSVTARPVIDDTRLDPHSSVSATVTQDQLRDQNAVDLSSALRRTPGVQISRYNPVGAFGGDQGGAIFIRGLGVSRPGSEIKTYIDGVPFYMGVWNHPLLDLLPINAMQSITVHKSPQPQFTGNNFAAVDLQTKRATEDGLHGEGRISAGSFRTVVEQAQLFGRQGDLDFTLAQGHAQSNGHRPNADGELNNLLGKVGWRITPQWQAEATFLHVDSKAHDPGDNRQPTAAIAPQYDTRASMFNAGLSHTHGDWRGTVKAYVNRGDGNWLNQPAPEGDTLTSFKMMGVRWKEQFSPWAGGTITAGIDHDQISGDVAFNRIAPAPQTRFDAPTFKITSPYAAVSHALSLGEAWSLIPSAGVRLYDHSEFKSKAAPHAGLSLVSGNLTVFANASRGINYPGLETTVLSSLIQPLGSSWTALSAEQLDHIELGAKFIPTEGTQVDVSVFRDKVKNRYVFGFPPEVPPPPQFINLGAYTMKGAELSVRHAIDSAWSVFTGLTLLDPSLDDLPYSPKQALTVGVTGKAGPVKVALDGQAQSAVNALNRSRAAGAANTEKVGGFAVFNARLAYPLPALGKQGEVFVAVENLLDRSHAYRPGYPMPGRSGQLGVAASF